MSQVDDIHEEYKHWEVIFDAISDSHNNGTEMPDMTKERLAAEKIDRDRGPEKLARAAKATQELMDRYPDGIPGTLLGRG